MCPLVVIGIGVLVVAWWMGRLPARLPCWLVAAAAAIVALSVLLSGQPLLAVALLAIAFWSYYAKRTNLRPDRRIAEARAVLGVSANATVADVNVAYRLAIAQAHPDRGGSEAVSQKINVARDTLLEHLGAAAQQPRA